MADDDAKESATRRRLLGAASAAIATGLAGCNSVVQVDREETVTERTVPAADVSSITVVDATDDIVVRTEQRDTVGVRLRKRVFGGTSPEDLSAELQTTDRTLEITTEKPNIVGIGGGSIDLELTVPPGITVDRLHTVDGDVTAQRLPSTARINTTDGDVSVTEATAGVTVDVTDGDVTLNGAGGPVELRTVDGDITARHAGSVAGIETQDGDIVADLPAVEGDADVITGDGDITVALGDDIDARIDARTDDGAVVVDGRVENADVRSRGETVFDAILGEGGDRVRIVTSDGDITLR